MKKLFAFSFALIASSTLYAQNRLTDSSATCIAYWKNKEKKVYVINHAKEKQEDSKVLSRSAFTYEAHINVKDSTGEGYTIEWQNKNYSSKEDPSVAQANAIFKNLKFIYKTDGTGTFLELINWEEVRDFYLELTRMSLPKNDTADAVWEKTKALFQTRKAVESSFIKDIQLFHSFFGSEYGTRLQSAKTTLPNLLGGDPIPAVQTVQVTRLQKNSPTFTVRTTQAIDRINATRFVSDLMKHFGGAEAKTTQEVEALFDNFNISDETEMDLQANTGWPATLNFKRSAKVMNVLQTESYSIYSKPDPNTVYIHPRD
jgi:hypothetical protein